MLSDRLVTRQMVAVNPAHAIRVPRHPSGKGSATVMSSEATSAFLKSSDTSDNTGLRDRTFIAVMVYSFTARGLTKGRCADRYA
jgi:site-specific recombinase XerC